MKKRVLTLLMVVPAALDSLQAAGTISQYTSRAAFTADDAIDWGGLGISPGGDKGLQIKGSFTGLRSALGGVVISGGVPGSNMKRWNEGLGFAGNFTGGDRLLATIVGDPGPLTIVFTSGPVYGAGLQIESMLTGPFTGQMKAFDVAGNLLGTMTVSGVHTAVLPADNTAPFMGIRSSLPEIAKIQIDTPGILGFIVNRLDVGLNAIGIANNTFFVKQLYQDLLSRAPSAAELTTAVGQLNAGTARGQVAAGVFNSAEFQANASFLARCYLGLLLRDPDFSSWSPILALMRSGTTQSATLDGFLATPEYQAAFPAGITDADFVTRLYRNLLNRAPEPGGLSYWTFVLSVGVPRSAVTMGFVQSPEFAARVQDRVTANLLYLTMLRRTGDSGGLNYWTVTLDFGVPVADVIQGFVGSPEYLARF